MKKYLIAFALLPFSVMAQDESGFSIKGEITGFPDGTVVSYLNRNTNGLDSVTVIQDNTFFIRGEHLHEPDFRFLVFDRQPPVIPVLMDNAEITISGSKDQLEDLQVAGSKVAEDYKALSSAYRPLDTIFQTQNFTPENIGLISGVSEKFVNEHPDSYASLLAISQTYQLTQSAHRAGAMADKMNKKLMNTELGRYLKMQIDEGKLTDIGSQILPFTQNDTANRPISIADFKGQYVLIDFWASWCMPCRVENPNVVANYNRFKDKNFTVLGVSLDQTKTAWLEAIKKDHLTWTHVSDLKYWENEVSNMFHITSIPRNLLIDPNGIIIAKNIRGEELGKTLERILLN